MVELSIAGVVVASLHVGQLGRGELGEVRGGLGRCRLAEIGIELFPFGAD